MSILPVKKIIISAETHPVLREGLASHGYEVEYHPGISYQQLLEIIKEAEGLVVTTRLKIDKALLNAAENLKWIGRLGSGMELIDAEYALKKGIRCISTPEGNSGAVGEHTLGLVLNLLNHITRSYNQIHNNVWLRNENRGRELAGRTVGVVGFGNTGSAFAKLLQPFNVTVLACDKYKDGFSKSYIKEASLEHIARYADIISFHLPLTNETKRMVNDAFFNSLKQSPIIINTCRGGIMDTAALIRALDANIISGAGLDVLENEKLSDLTGQQRLELNSLMANPNVVITPHIAGYSEEAYRRMAEVLLRKLEL